MNRSAGINREPRGGRLDILEFGLPWDGKMRVIDQGSIEGKAVGINRFFLQYNTKVGPLNIFYLVNVRVLDDSFLPDYVSTASDSIITRFNNIINIITHPFMALGGKV